MGNIQSELQHIANALSGLSGDEQKFLQAVLGGRILVSMDLTMNTALSGDPDGLKLVYLTVHAWHCTILS